MTIFKSFRFISKKAIEARATQILTSIQFSCNYRPKWPLDTSRIAEFLNLDIVWDSIPPDQEGAIAARIIPLERLIEMNEEISDLRGAFGESTIAHEIGHWVLHIDQTVVERCLRLKDKGIYVPNQVLLCRNEREMAGMEWQAQYFASCLLMPQFALVKAQEGKDLTKWGDLYTMAEELGVTISNLLHRLKDLHWIKIKEGSRQIVLAQGSLSWKKPEILKV